MRLLYGASVSTTVYRAVADPHRRMLLDALRDQGDQSLTALCSGLQITRQAVTKHLAVLEDADLVRVRRHGRERLHSLNAAPLQDMVTWAATYSTFWNDRLDALETQLSQPD
jgi:DNA-binding transcriptional ArsR family regulator